jgi:hypothetical protein
MPLIERVFWWPTLICAILLFPSWILPKTERFYRGTTEIQGWGWQNVASWTGGLVILLLLIGYASRPRVPGPALCALLAAGLFAATAAESARTWLDLRIEAQELALGATSGYTLNPATGMDGTIQKALVGAACALVLLGLWLRPGKKPAVVPLPPPILPLAGLLALAPASSLALASLPPGATVPEAAQCQADILSLSAEDARQALEPFPRDPLYLAAPLDNATIFLNAQPTGTPADEQTIAAITRLEVEVAACLNAGQLWRAASLTSGRWQQHVLRDILFIGQSSGIGGSPPARAGIPFVLVSDVQTFPGNRAGAVVAWDIAQSENTGSPMHYHVYEWIGGAWRLADELPVS